MCLLSGHQLNKETSVFAWIRKCFVIVFLSQIMFVMETCDAKLMSTTIITLYGHLSSARSKAGVVLVSSLYVWNNVLNEGLGS